MVSYGCHQLDCMGDHFGAAYFSLTTQAKCLDEVALPGGAGIKEGSQGKNLASLSHLVPFVKAFGTMGPETSLNYQVSPQLAQVHYFLSRNEGSACHQGDSTNTLDPTTVF
jgi:hypothetical protein